MARRLVVDGLNGPFFAAIGKYQSGTESIELVPVFRLAPGFELMRDLPADKVWQV
jgi:hypothetical protein